MGWPLLRLRTCLVSHGTTQASGENLTVLATTYPIQEPRWEHLAPDGVLFFCTATTRVDLNEPITSHSRRHAHIGKLKKALKSPCGSLRTADTTFSPVADTARTKFRQCRDDAEPASIQLMNNPSSRSRQDHALSGRRSHNQSAVHGENLDHSNPHGRPVCYRADHGRCRFATARRTRRRARGPSP